MFGGDIIDHPAGRDIYDDRAGIGFQDMPDGQGNRAILADWRAELIDDCQAICIGILCESDIGAG
jgi:hypothetical protein